MNSEGVGQTGRGPDWPPWFLGDEATLCLSGDPLAWGISVYLDLMVHQKHGIHGSQAAAGLNEAWPFLQEKLKPEAVQPGREG